MNRINTDIKLENTQDLAGRKALILAYKNIIKTVKPKKDETYGNVYQQLFLDDYVIYALLRNKQDFTSCSSNDRFRAINIAQNLKLQLEKYLNTLDELGEGVADSFIPNKLNIKAEFNKKEVYSQLVDDISSAIENAKIKYQYYMLYDLQIYINKNKDLSINKDLLIKKYIKNFLDDDLQDKEISLSSIDSFNNLLRFINALSSLSTKIHISLDENELFLISLHKTNVDEKSSINIYFNVDNSLHYAVVKMDDNRNLSSFSGTADIKNNKEIEILTLFKLLD